MTIPFFSVVIPTKGRSFLVADAVESVLRQSFTDFEVVVIDNDDANETRDSLSRFKDSRFRHFRTGGLSMPDNWEQACAQARGEYMLLLEDKQALRGRALEEIYQVVESTRPPALKWLADSLDDTGSVTWVDEGGGSGQVRAMSSIEVLRRFLQGTVSEGWQYLPIGHLSAFSRDLRSRILAGPTGRLCPPVSPDYTIAIQAVAYSDTVHLIDKPLVAMSRRHSNGRSFARKTPLGRQFMTELGGAGRLWTRTPIQAPLIPALLFNDYLELQSLIGGRLKASPLDWTNYYVQCWQSVMSMENDGIPSAPEEAAFRSALAAESAELQANVWKSIEAREGSVARSRRKNRLKSLRRRLGLLALEHSFKLFQRRIGGRKHVGQFKRPLEYVIWADQQQSNRRPAAMANSPRLSAV